MSHQADGPSYPLKPVSKSTLRPRDLSPSNSDNLSGSSPVVLSRPSSRSPSRAGTPLEHLHTSSANKEKHARFELPEEKREEDQDSDFGFEDWDEEGEDMPSDLRPSLSRGTSQHKAPLLGDYSSPDGRHHSRRSTLHERDPEREAHVATKKRYSYAGFFLALSLVSFAIQTETAVYIQHYLKWNKAYCMLYLTHGSWSLLWPAQLLILRLQDRKTPWKTFWNRHLQMLKQTGQMVQFQTLHPVGREATTNPWPHIFKMTALVTCALTVAGGSWYVAVDYTTASDLTAIYNCSAFFAYAFSIPLLHEKVKLSKIISVAIAIGGVLVVAYGDSAPAKHGSKSGGGAGGELAPPSEDASNRFLGNIVIGIGSVLYGLYEVLYKKVACPPDGCAPFRSMTFAVLFGSMIGCFTLSFLWIPLPFLNWLGWEQFGLPTGEAAWMMLFSVLANATFSGAFLVLISLTSPVLSSVAALLTIFVVALLDQLLPPPLYSPLTAAGVVGGILIIIAFGMLSYASYLEMDEERKSKMADEIEESDTESLA